MGKEVWRLLTSLVIWLTKMELAWQSSVTTARTEHSLVAMMILGVTHVTFITPERICLSCRVSPKSPHGVNSLSSMSVITRVCSKIKRNLLDGGCHVVQQRWPTGVDHQLVVASAHAGTPIRMPSPNVVVTVIKMTMSGVKTAVSSLTRHSFQSYSSGLEILAVHKRKGTTHWEN